MENVKIIEATSNDVTTLQKIGKLTFMETFANANTAGNMDNYLNEAFSLDKLTSELNDKNALFYFAILNKNVIGYLKLNIGTSQTEIKDEKALEIERIYVLKAFQGKKIGQILYEKAVEIAHLKKATYIWLGVWEKNPGAISFYKKNGFVTFDKHIFKLGDDEQTDIMMKYILS